MNYRYILFDLDGTLINSHEGIMEAAEFALNKIGVPATQIINLERMIGPPLKSSFRNFFSLSNEFADKAIEYYREKYRAEGMLKCEVYEGIPQLLAGLKNEGFVLAVATSKPTVFARKILDNLELSKYFDLIEGANMDDTRSDKAEIIEHVCKDLNIVNTSECVMIGDRMFDIIGAATMNISSIGVMYGFGSLEEFREAGATYVVNTVNELAQLLYSLKNHNE